MTFTTNNVSPNATAPQPHIKLTLVTINGRSVMMDLPVDADGKVRIDLVDVQKIAKDLGLPDGCCICIGH